MFKKFIKSNKLKKEKLKNGVSLEIQSKKLKSDVEFVLYHLPKELVKGMEIIEQIYEQKHEPHQIIVKTTMNAIEIKQSIGLFIFREKRWERQEEITKKLLAEEKIDLKMFHEIHKTDNYLKVYELINADVFAVAYGNTSLNIDEIAYAVNNLYIKKFTDINFSKQYNLNSLVDSLFEKSDH